MRNFDLRQLLHSGGLNFAGMALRLGLSFVVVSVAARYLGKADYGAVSVGTTILTSVSTLTMLGFGQGIGGYLPRFDSPNDRRGIILSAFTVVMPISLAAGVGIAVFAEPLAVHVLENEALTPIIQVCALGIPAANLAQLAVSTIRGNKQTLPKVIVDDVALLGVRVLTVFVFVLLGADALAIASAYPLSFLVSASIGVYFLVRDTPLFSQIEASNLRRELTKYSLPLWISAAMGIVYSAFDTFVLAYFAEVSAVGVYKVVYPLSHHLSIVLISLGYIVLPTFSQLHSEGNFSEMKSYYQSVSTWILLGTLPPFLVLLVFGRPVIGVLFGAEYTTGHQALSVLAFGFFVHSVVGPNSEVLKSIDEPKLVMINDTLSAVLNFALNIVLVPRYSFFGAAVATAISYIFLNCAYSYQLYQRTGIHPFSTRYVGLLFLSLVIVLLYGTGTFPHLIR